MSPRRQMGELEAAVMSVLWEHNGWLTPGEVLERLQHADDLAYGTILTILIRLYKKDRLERQRDGKAHAYRPLQTREEYTAARMHELLARSDRPSALVHFVSTLSPADRSQLKRALSRSPKDPE